MTVSDALEARAAANIKVRQPLGSLTIKLDISKDLQQIVADEVNVEEVLVDTALNGDVTLDTTITPELQKKETYVNLSALFKTLVKAGLQPGEAAKATVEAPAATLSLVEEFAADIVAQTHVEVSVGDTQEEITVTIT